MALWLWLIGVDFALLWGVMFFLFNYAPTVGSIVAGVLATLVALLQLGPLWAAVAAAGMIAIDQAIGNVLDPHLQGRSLDISPLVVLVSVIFWGWIWGLGHAAGGADDRHDHHAVRAGTGAAADRHPDERRPRGRRGG